MEKTVDYNHISKNLSEDEVNKLKKWYLYYHKLYTCYKWKYKKTEENKSELKYDKYRIDSNWYYSWWYNIESHCFRLY